MIGPDDVIAELPQELAVEAAEPALLLQPERVIDLAPLFPPDAKLVGYAMSDLGQRYVLDAHRGIYELVQGEARLVFSLPDSTVAGGEGDGLPPVELTDMALAYLSPDSAEPWFVLTAENDGYALAPGSSLLQSYFCYLPPVSEWPSSYAPSVSQSLRAQGIAVVERTDGVGVNSATGQIFAQPRTFRLDTGELAATELFVFDASGGQPINTRLIQNAEFHAGSMLVGSSSLLLGWRDELYRVEAWGGSLQRIGRVAGVASVEGLGWGPEHRLVLLDGPGKRLYEIDHLSYFPPGMDGAL
ncbi:MAG: hypothetical protein ABW217_19065 [Polyangiaceae bacterium]